MKVGVVYAAKALNGLAKVLVVRRTCLCGEHMTYEENRLDDEPPLAMRFFHNGRLPTPSFFEDRDLDLIDAFSLVGDEIDLEFSGLTGLEMG